MPVGGKILYQVTPTDSNILQLDIVEKEQTVRNIAICNVSTSRQRVKLFCSNDGVTFDNTTLVIPNSPIEVEQILELCRTYVLFPPNRWAIQCETGNSVTLTMWGFNR